MSEANEPIALRELIVRRFEAWLDDALADEMSLAGLDAELVAPALNGTSGEARSDPAGQPEQSDIYSLWSAVAALTGEVKLQGRSFRQLTEALAPVPGLADKINAALNAHDEALSAARAIAEGARAVSGEWDDSFMQAARDAAAREFVDLLLDLNDRLGRGRALAREDLAKARRLAQPGWLGRWLGRSRAVDSLLDATKALADGYEMSLGRLAESLGQIGISRVAPEGERFDPQRMTAVDVVETDDIADGTVVEVYRAGYEWHGQPYRLAEVKVARAPRGVEGGGGAGEDEAEDVPAPEAEPDEGSVRQGRIAVDGGDDER